VRDGVVSYVFDCLYFGIFLLVFYYILRASSVRIIFICVFVSVLLKFWYGLKKVVFLLYCFLFLCKLREIWGFGMFLVRLEIDK